MNFYDLLKARVGTAYGRPYGASGAILLIHLLAALKNGLGLISIAGAGGTGEAILIEALR